MGDIWALVDLLRSDYPDPDIERNLLDRLLDYYEKDEYAIQNIS